MAPKAPISRIKAATTAYGSTADSLEQLDAARRLREAADELEAAAIRGARKHGVTWAAIGALYGLTKQGAQQRFRPAEHGTTPQVAAPGKKAARKAAPRKAETAAPRARRR